MAIQPTPLTIPLLRNEASLFAAQVHHQYEPTLYGTSDGKAVGTVLEARFTAFLQSKGYFFERGNAANGLDFPGLNVDIKTTRVEQPQSSCPFRGLDQKVFGLGYGLIVFIYKKVDFPDQSTSQVFILEVVFVDRERTADFTMTKGLRELLADGANEEEIASFMQSRALTEDYNYLMELAAKVIARPPEQGYLTISPALQWRLQYKRAMAAAGTVVGVDSVYRQYL